jgi:hypothetical protein
MSLSAPYSQIQRYHPEIGEIKLSRQDQKTGEQMIINYAILIKDENHLLELRMGDLVNHLRGSYKR